MSPPFSLSSALTTATGQTFHDSIVEHAKANEQVQRWAAANPIQTFSLPMKAKLRDVLVDRMDKNEKNATRYLIEQDFESVAFAAIVKRIYEDLKQDRPAS
jgi:hypothetical protein